MKAKLILSSLFFLTSCLKYKSPIFYFHNVSDKPLKNINCNFKNQKFKLKDLNHVFNPTHDDFSRAGIYSYFVGVVDIFQLRISDSEYIDKHEFFGDMVCNLETVNGLKNFKFKITENDLKLSDVRYYESSLFFRALCFISCTVFPCTKPKPEFYSSMIEVFIAQDGFDVLFFSFDDEFSKKNPWKKSKEYEEIIRANKLNYLREKLLNKNLNY